MMARFGKDTIGSGRYGNGNSVIAGSWFLCPESGKAESIAAYFAFLGQREYTAKAAIYRKSDGALVAYTGIVKLPLMSPYDPIFEKGWVVFPIIWGGNLTAGDYWLVCYLWPAYLLVAFAAAEAGKGTVVSRGLDPNNPADWPATLPIGLQAYAFSVYCTYSPAVPPAPTTANLRGTVANKVTGAPLGGVQVIMDGMLTNTLSNGTFWFTDVVPKAYTLKLEKYGYRALEVSVDLRLPGDYEITLEMEPIPIHTLTVKSTPITGVPFTISGVKATTPYSKLLLDGFYPIVMPAVIQVAGSYYEFKHWEDGSTSFARTINLTADMAITATYEAVELATPIIQMRPDMCEVCEVGYAALEYTLARAVVRRYYIEDLKSDFATRTQLERAIAELKPPFFHAFGHGNETIFTGQWMKTVLQVGLNEGIMAGMITYLLSCLTGVELGPAIIRAGGKAFIGYKVEWTWLDEDSKGDPYLDYWARGYYEGSNAIVFAILDGLTTRQAVEAGYNKYTEWINYWASSGDPYAATAIQWLIWDRDNCVLLGDELARITPPSPPPTHMLSLASDKLAYYVDETVLLSGHLTLDGSPVPGVLVTLYRNGVARLETFTLSDGSYGFADPPLVGSLEYHTEHVIGELIFRSPSLRVRRH